MVLGDHDNAVVADVNMNIVHTNIKEFSGNGTNENFSGIKNVHDNDNFEGDGVMHSQVVES